MKSSPGTRGFRTAPGRGAADSAYFAAKPLGLRAGAVMVWAGMRGAVTLTAAQTLPEERSRIRGVLAEAANGVSVPPGAADTLEAGGLAPEQIPAATVLDLARAARGAGATDPAVVGELTGYAVDLVRAQRLALLDERDSGHIDAEDFNRQLRILDVEQLAVEEQEREYAARLEDSV